MLEFKPITLDLREEYEKRFKKCPVKSADYTFANIWGWADKYGLTMAFTDNFAIIHQKFPYHCIWAPVGNWQEMDMQVFDKLLESDELPFSEEASTVCCGTLYTRKLCMHRVTDDLAQYITQNYKGNVAIVEAKGQWEYIYSRNDLATLSGNRFHKKKNHVNAFYRSYPNCEFHPLTLETGVKGSLDEVLSLQEEWCKWHDCEHSPSLFSENDAVFRVIGNWERLGNLFGGSLYIEDKMVAFSVGEALDDKTVVVHFEKAMNDYRGIYQAINYAFVNNCTEGFEFINREQDMDEEGIRKAKQSYNPIDYLKKSTLVFTL